jgi:hypothetical protein
MGVQITHGPPPTKPVEKPIGGSAPTPPVIVPPASLQGSVPPVAPPTDGTVVSAPQTGEPLTAEARRQRYAAIRARMGRSMLEVTPPPGSGKAAYWAYKEDARELTRLQFMGFEIVHELDPKNPKWKASGLQPDGTYVIGDIILMEIDEELYNLHKQDVADRAEALIRGGSEAVQARLAEQGVPTFEVSKTRKG